MHNPANTLHASELLNSEIRGEIRKFTPEAATSPRASSQEIRQILTIRLDGTFDGATAWDLRRRLEDLGESCGERVVIDFSKVREFYDFGVAVLANGLLERSGALPRVILRGLRTHQMRLLQYFGVGLGEEVGG